MEDEGRSEGQEEKPGVGGEFGGEGLVLQPGSAAPLQQLSLCLSSLCIQASRSIKKSQAAFLLFTFIKIRLLHSYCINLKGSKSMLYFHLGVMSGRLSIRAACPAPAVLTSPGGTLYLRAGGCKCLPMLFISF